MYIIEWLLTTAFVDLFVDNICFIQIRTKLSSVSLLSLVRIFMKQTLIYQIYEICIFEETRPYETSIYFDILLLIYHFYKVISG